MLPTELKAVEVEPKPRSREQKAGSVGRENAAEEVQKKNDNESTEADERSFPQTARRKHNAIFNNRSPRPVQSDYRKRRGHDD